MSKCLNCKIEILDETGRCPLCQSILKQTEALENMYPDVRIRLRRLDFFSRIYLFFSIILEVLLFSINFIRYDGIWWCAIPALALLYGYVVLRYAVIGQSGYRSKAILLTLLFVLITIAIDFITGYRGWSLDYILPLGILAMDIIIIICMIINRKNWQSYLMWQLLTVLCSIIPILFYLLGMEKQLPFVLLPMAASAILFLGTMILGGRRAKTELKRRFHIN